MNVLYDLYTFASELVHENFRMLFLSFLLNFLIMATSVRSENLVNCRCLHLA